MRRSVLFVDDEPRILDGLRRSLRDLRHDWDLRFAAGGEAAVEALDPTLTVVVSDMRMPGLDGVDVLTAARGRAPGAARMILSGNSDRGTALRAVGLAHRFLAKPCEAAVLLDLLPELASCVEAGAEVAALGGPPADAARLSAVRALLGSGAGPVEVAALVEQEPALALLVLHAAASSFVVPGRPCPDVRTAVEHLGPPVLRELLEQPGLLDVVGDAPRALAPGTAGALAGLAPLLPPGTLVPLLRLWGLTPTLLAEVEAVSAEGLVHR